MRLFLLVSILVIFVQFSIGYLKLAANVLSDNIQYEIPLIPIDNKSQTNIAIGSTPPTLYSQSFLSKVLLDMSIYP